MDTTINEVLQLVEENNIKFVRLSFCDIFGTEKNITIMAEELPRAFKDGISFDASAVKGFMNVNESDLFLFPDASTISILPWSPSSGRTLKMYCNICYPDKKPFESDGRIILGHAMEIAKQEGYIVKIGAETEFYLFKLDDNGEATNITHDNAGYMDIPPKDKGDHVRREICLTLEEFDIKPVSAHHEQGPGQNEIDFRYADALETADNLITFKSVVEMVAGRNGLNADFRPKPMKDVSGSGFHINISLFRDNENIFSDESMHKKDAEHFIAGILDKIEEITAFLNPSHNSYDRFGAFEAPKYISWSHQNRSQLIRIPAQSGEYSRMELRSPDCMCNPYIAFALVIHAGIEGIKLKKELPSPVDENLFESCEIKNSLKTLPQNLYEAIEIMKKSEFVKSIIPEKTILKFVEQAIKS
ncbi:MAG: glutamine synthetase family protein [Proteocatella sp.]